MINLIKNISEIISNLSNILKKEKTPEQHTTIYQNSIVQNNYIESSKQTTTTNRTKKRQQYNFFVILLLIVQIIVTIRALMSYQEINIAIISFLKNNPIQAFLELISTNIGCKYIYEFIFHVGGYICSFIGAWLMIRSLKKPKKLSGLLLGFLSTISLMYIQFPIQLISYLFYK